MATTQKLLGEAVGIQFTGTRDETGTNPILGLTDGLIVGQFRRGRTDKPMRITQQNIRAELGYQPDNKFYRAVQAALDQFPFVWVLRVGSGGVVVTPPVFNLYWEWLNQFEIIDKQYIRYDAYKEGSVSHYQSYAVVGLAEALITSFMNENMQPCKPH